MSWGIYTYLLAEQGLIGKRGQLKDYRGLYRGDSGITYQMLLQKWFAPEISITTGFQESRRNFAIRNELRVIIDKRVMPMPKAWQFRAPPTDEEPDDDEDDALGEDDRKALVEELNEWANSPKSGDRGVSLVAKTPAITHDQELDGNAALVMDMGPNGVPRVALRDTHHLGVDIDTLTQEIAAARFAWSLNVQGSDKDNAKTIEYVQQFTREGTSTLTVDGEPAKGYEPVAMGFLPLVLIPRALEHGKPIGTSGVAELVESYADFLWAAHLMNVANKLEGFGIYCPADGTDPSVFMDSNGKVITSFQLSPGCFYPFSLKKIGGGINIASIAEQYDRAEGTLYRLGKVKRDRSETSDMRSGKAMVIDTHELRDYITDKTTLLRTGLEHIADMYCWATGKLQYPQRSGIGVEFEALDTEDHQENTKRAELWLKAEMAGKATTEQRLREWQRLGILDEDADVVGMALEVAEAKEEAAAAFMAKAPGLAGQKPPPRNQPVAEGAPGAETDAEPAAEDVKLDG